MSKKVVILLVVLLAVCGLGYAAYVYQEQLMVALGMVDVVKEDPRANIDKAQLKPADEVQTVEPAAQDKVFELTEDHVAVSFVAYKHVGGKLAKVGGGWEKGLGDPPAKISGKAICDPAGKTLKQVRLEIQVDTLWSEHPMLTRALKERGFFQIDKYPKLTFISTGIQPAPSGLKMEGATHLMTGLLTINGQSRLVSFPVKMQLSADGLQLDSRFTIDRKPFNLHYTNPWPGMSLKDENIDDDVVMTITVKTAGLGDDGQDTGSSDGNTGDAGTVDLSKLPKEVVVQPDFCNRPFEMVLVKGDPAKGIKPFYISKYETTWDQFMDWAYCKDLTEEQAAKARARKERPSTPYESVDRGYGQDGYPALSMSRLSAELYCKWLSKKTGKKFRLPTEAEWEQAYREGGYDPTKPLTEEQANEMAVWMGNSRNEDLDDKYTTRPVGSKKPNKLGIYDMAGNVAEWVTGTGEDRVVRGGHFDGEFADLGGALEHQGCGRAIEDQDVWNETYPNYPKSIWWFVEGRWVGFRVVMEASSALDSSGKTH